MKIALLARSVHPLHGHGGLERHVAALKLYLILAGCDVRLFTCPPLNPSFSMNDNTDVFVPYQTVPLPRAKGFVIVDRNTNYLLWSLRAARKLFRSFEPDVVQADGGAGFGYAFCGKKDSAPLVLHPHGMEEFKTTRLKHMAYWPLRKATRYAAKRAACVIAPDAGMEEEVQQNLGVPKAKICTIPNAIDLELIDRTREPISLASYGIKGNEKVLLSVGRLEENKGFADLVHALSRVQEKVKVDWRWVLVGAGPKYHSLARVIQRSAIQDRVCMTGSLSDQQLFALYDRADLFVHPTRYEGSSMVTLEAMSHRTAVIGTRVGGIPDKIRDGASGRLVPPKDVGALVQAIVDSISNPEILLKWGMEGRRIVEEKFSWQQRTEELLGLYEKIIR